MVIHLVALRQTSYTEAERKVCDIRLRAELWVGELLRELAAADKPNSDCVGGRSGKFDMPRSGGYQSKIGEVSKYNGKIAVRVRRLSGPTPTVILQTRSCPHQQRPLSHDLYKFSERSGRCGPCERP